MGEAVALLEVYGLVAAFAAADAGCKAADVSLEIFDRNKPANADKLPVPLLMTVKYRGTVSAVKEALKAGHEAADKVSGVVTEYVIPHPDADTEKMLKLSGLDKLPSGL